GGGQLRRHLPGRGRDGQGAVRSVRRFRRSLRAPLLRSALLTHYLVSLEYRFSGEMQRGAPDYVLLNSGIMLHAQDPRTMPREQDWPISVEMQFYALIPGQRPRPTGNLCTPGTHVVYNGRLDTRHCINASGQALP